MLGEQPFNDIDKDFKTDYIKFMTQIFMTITLRVYTKKVELVREKDWLFGKKIVITVSNIQHCLQVFH